MYVYIEVINQKTISTTSPVRRSPATQTGHTQTQTAGLAISSPLTITTLPKEERSFKLPDYCIVYQTKLTAIIEACKFLSTSTNTHIIIILSNSLFSTQAISSLSTRSSTTKDCYDSLNALGSTNTLESRDNIISLDTFASPHQPAEQVLYLKNKQM